MCCSKPIFNPNSKDKNHYQLKNWNLVFTRTGRYFFYNEQSGERCWIPPVEVVELIKKSFGPTKMEMFFDPFYVEEESESEEEFEESEESEEESIEVDFLTKKSDTDTEDEFKLYLLKNSIDPFAPWPTILAAHSSSPEFVAIPSDRHRQDLFNQVCPLLIEQKREITRKKLKEAGDWWQQIKEENWRIGATWFQVLKKVKGNQKFALLNEKDCEKDYKNKK